MRAAVPPAMPPAVPPAVPEHTAETQRLRCNLTDLVELLELYQAELQACADEGIVFAVYGENKHAVDHRLARCAYHINGLKQAGERYEAKISGSNIFSAI